MNDVLTPEASKPLSEYDVSIATRWVDFSLKLIKNTPGFTQPVSSRALGYANLAMYESSVYGIPGNKSLVGQINGLAFLSIPELSQKYNWALSLNTAQHQILKDLFMNTSATNKQQLDSLKLKIETELILANKDNIEVIKRSNTFGLEIAKAIFEYSKSDGGHEGYNKNYTSEYILGKGICFWEPTENKIKIPLQPYWGQNRTFLADNASVIIPKIKTPSFNSSSEFFKEYKAVYDKNISLTQSEKEIAIWWFDEPVESFTPAGHSFNIAKLAILKKKAKLDVAVETFTKIGLAVSDAFVLNWKSKYTFLNMRPFSYLRQTIAPDWIPFLPAPPFPGFSCEQATQSAASASVLESVFGPNFEFIDSTWEGRPKDLKRNVEYKSRKYISFWAAAEESAHSRYLAGINTKMDNVAGLEMGKKIGQNITKLQFKK